jgi:hypothetical protein
LKPGEEVVGADESDPGMRREDATEEANCPALVAPVPLGVQQEHEPQAELVVELPELACRGLGLPQIAHVERLLELSLGGGFHIHRTDVRIGVKAPREAATRHRERADRAEAVGRGPSIRPPSGLLVPGSSGARGCRWRYLPSELETR